MAYPTVPNSFIESATAYATAVNANFAAIIAGISDGSKDGNINDLTVNGSFTPVNQIRAKDIQPNADLTYNLGSAAARWNQVYINSMTVASSMTVGALNVTNTATVNGNLVVASAASTNLYSTAVVQHIQPRATNTWDLGSTALRFANGHIDYVQPGTKITFCSGVGIRYTSIGNYLYYDASFHGVNGTLSANDAFECVGTAAFNGNVAIGNYATFTGATSASWVAVPTMTRHYIEGYGSGANQTIELDSGPMLPGSILILTYNAWGYRAIIQGGGADVAINATRRNVEYIKREDNNWYPLGNPSMTAVSAASGTSECVDQFNELLNNLWYAGLML